MRGTAEGEVCPQRIVDDFGICYALGIGLGTLVNGVRGAWSGPKKRKMATAVEMIKRRVPQFACSFGLWGGAFGLAHCLLIMNFDYDGILFQALSGGFAGGILNIRGNPNLYRWLLLHAARIRRGICIAWIDGRRREDLD